jgi:DNA-binding PadR family transcriptional regulator
MKDRQLYSGLVRLYVLHAADERPFFGLELMEDLARKGYRISAGTLYPLLHDMERSGYLRSDRRRFARRYRRIYRTTPLGRKALDLAEGKLQALFGRLVHRSGH